jgi:hypothetical protein
VDSLRTSAEARPAPPGTRSDSPEPPAGRRSLRTPPRREGGAAPAGPHQASCSLPTTPAPARVPLAATGPALRMVGSSVGCGWAGLRLSRGAGPLSSLGPELPWSWVGPRLPRGWESRWPSVGWPGGLGPLSSLGRETALVVGRAFAPRDREFRWPRVGLPAVGSEGWAFVFVRFGAASAAGWACLRPVRSPFGRGRPVARGGECGLGVVTSIRSGVPLPAGWGSVRGRGVRAGRRRRASRRRRGGHRRSGGGAGGRRARSDGRPSHRGGPGRRR